MRKEPVKPAVNTVDKTAANTVRKMRGGGYHEVRNQFCCQLARAFFAAVLIAASAPLHAAASSRPTMAARSQPGSPEWTPRGSAGKSTRWCRSAHNVRRKLPRKSAEKFFQQSGMFAKLPL